MFLKVLKVRLTPQQRTLRQPWAITWDSDMSVLTSPSQYQIKQNMWKAKRLRKLRIKEVEKSHGSVSLCPKCDGLGHSNNNFIYHCLCCKGLGIMDWILRVRR